MSSTFLERAFDKFFFDMHYLFYVLKFQKKFSKTKIRFFKNLKK